MKYSDDGTQPGCIWGLVHVFDYHNVKKMIRHRKHGPPIRDTHGWSSIETSVFQDDAYQEKLLDDKDRLEHRSRATKKRSLRARLKALISEEISIENTNTPHLASKPSLQRTYSIHHLESFDNCFNKICTDVISRPKDADTDTPSTVNVDANTEAKLDSKDNPDVFEIFKVDKELLLKNQEKGIATFSRTAFRLSKSRSFPVAHLADGTKLKPIKLESKLKEVWSFPKENRSENVIGKRTHRRSLSLVESLARLLENSSEKDARLNSSKSLKLSNEYGLAPLYFRSIHSQSYVDSDLNFEAPVDDPSGKRLVAVEIDSTGMQNTSMDAELEIEGHSGSSMKLDDLSEEAKNGDGEEEFLDHGEATNAQISPNIEKDEIADKVTDKSPNKKKYSDLDYVRHLLDQSGIAAEMTLPLSPQLFEELEARWPHEEHELNGWPDFHGCWHHQMLFDLVNEALVEVYDVSLPYYPKSLSSSCHVRPFPMGNCIVEEVCRSIGRLKADEMQSLDCIVGRDLAWDRSWMNLQMETEFIALHLEDILFNELLHEVVCS